MRKQIVPILTMLVAFVLLVACRPAPNAPDSAASPTSAPTTPATEAAPATTAAPATEPAAAAEAATATVPAADPTPVPDESPTAVSPFGGVSWDDRAVFAAGLTPDQQALLDELPNAPVYHMILDIDDRLSAVGGRLAVRYTNEEAIPLDEIYFHLYPNLLDGSIEIANLTVDGQMVTPQLEGVNNSVMRLPLPAPLAPGEQVVVDMVFTTEPADRIARNYGVLANVDGVLALAHFFPQIAVYDDEGWNIETPDINGDVSYSDAAYYLVQVSAPEQATVAAGGVAVDEQTENGRTTTTYAAGPMRDFFLAASNDYIVLSEQVGDITVNSYAPAGVEAGAQSALETAVDSLAIFSDLFGPYPYSELDLVTTSTAALGIEYPGIVVNTVRMYDPDNESDRFPAAVLLESTTAHEVAHQWFYGLIGNDQLDEPWLDEALTQYATYRYYLAQYGEQGGEGFFRSLQSRWERIEEADIPIGQPVAAYSGPEYGAIVYGRGPIFVRTLAEEMGQETFDAFLRDYYARYRLGIADGASFQALAESHCDCDLGPLFAEWVLSN